MRRAVLGLLSFVAVFALLTTLSCQRSNSLRIVSVNADKTSGIVYCDLGDYGVFRDPTDPEAEPEWIVAIGDELAEVELQYVEIGPGLPTWTPYQAHISKCKVKYTFVAGEDPGPIPDVNLPVKMTVMSDPTGEKTATGIINVLPAVWKEEYWGSPPGEPETDPTELTILRATITLEGTDDATGKAVRAVNDVQLKVGNFWDDPSRIGQ
jgi:hypothetical protein